MTAQYLEVGGGRRCFRFLDGCVRTAIAGTSGILHYTALHYTTLHHCTAAVPLHAPVPKRSQARTASVFVVVDLNEFKRLLTFVGRPRTIGDYVGSSCGKQNTFKTMIDLLLFVSPATRYINTTRYLFACAAGVVTKTTDRDSLRYTYNGTRRVRQLALGCESS